MAQADFIPAGRTSRIVKGAVELQIQTEYAYRPSPRLTTSIFSKGQVLHKIEKDLAAPIGSMEEKLKVEGLLRKQHMEVMEILNDGQFVNRIMQQISPPTPPSGVKIARSPEPPRKTAPVDTPTAVETAPLRPKVSLLNRFSEIEGVEKIYRIDPDGNFDSDVVSSDLKKKYAPIFKGLRELLDIFRDMPGGRKEEGVYVIEHNRLYLISSGFEFYFVLTRRQKTSKNFEAEFHRLILEQFS